MVAKVVGARFIAPFPPRDKRRWAAALPLLLLAAWLCAANTQEGVAAGPTANGTQPFDCARIHEFGIDKQTNFRAMEIMAACSGRKFALPGATSLLASAEALVSKLKPLDYGGTDANVSSPVGDGPYPKVTQSESMVSANGNQIIVNYNDSRTSPQCYAGYSWSSDGGTTWTRPGGAAGASPLCSGHGTTWGDPTVVYSVRDSKWYLSDLVTGCGGQGIGVWESTDGQNVTPGACAHNGSSDDRQSHWIDNSPSSPYYGRQYISWNNFADGQNIFVTYSDNGVNWSNPVRVQTGGFIRNVQLTGSPSDGTVFIAAMNEGGGGSNNRTNIMYRSTNGGANWTAFTMGAPFIPPGDELCTGSTYFYMVAPIWRYMGWGQPAVGPNQTVHYVYAGQGATSADKGDIYYVRSTDNGSTWSTPMRLNSDTGIRSQWMPSLVATWERAVFAAWYDRRDTTDNSYRWYGRLSTGNGYTWQPDAPVNDVVSPQPLQPDPSVQACYVGDYNYASADGYWGYTTWNTHQWQPTTRCVFRQDKYAGGYAHQSTYAMHPGLYQYTHQYTHPHPYPHPYGHLYRRHPLWQLYLRHCDRHHRTRRGRHRQPLRRLHDQHFAAISGEVLPQLDLHYSKRVVQRQLAVRNQRH